MNWEITLKKEKTNQKNEGQIKKNKITKTLIEGCNWKPKTLTK